MSRSQASRRAPFVFEDTSSRALLATIRQVAPSNATVLVTGETGTGKEIVARHVHDLSHRRDRPFVAINCSSLPDTLIESELFGHERGAFTGANTSKAGWFECADGATLFLDEIGDLPLGAQAKLLRVLQEGEVVRLGSRRPIPIDVRVLAATNVRLEEAVIARRFREDLYYRVHVAPLVLAPLRHRPGDILPLARRFIGLHAAEGNVEIADDAEQRLLEHTWPGNVRELENVIQYALLLCRDNVITVGDLRFAREAPSPSEAVPVLESNRLESALAAMFEKNLPHLHQQIERTVFRAAFRYCHGNQLETARLLGISRNIVRARLIQAGDLRSHVPLAL